MKTKQKGMCFIVLVVFSVICCIDGNSQEMHTEKTWEEVRLSEQIPEAILKSMSTEELIRSYLNSRYPGYLLAYNNIQDAFEREYEDFNGLRELLNRRDVANKLIEFYKNMDPAAYDPNWELVKIGKFAFSIVYIETLLAHKNIHDKLTKSETKALLTELIKKNESKVRHPEVYSIVGVQFNAHSIAKLLDAKGKDIGASQFLPQSQSMNCLLKTGRLLNKDDNLIIIQKAHEYLNIY